MWITDSGKTSNCYACMKVRDISGTCCPYVWLEISHCYCFKKKMAMLKRNYFKTWACSRYMLLKRSRRFEIFCLQYTKCLLFLRQENCVVMRMYKGHEGRWADIDCSQKMGFVCQAAQGRSRGKSVNNVFLILSIQMKDWHSKNRKYNNIYKHFISRSSLLKSVLIRWLNIV